jgi:predicted DNA-binding transcriptional regulator YafY
MTGGAGERLRRLLEIIPRVAATQSVAIASLAHDIGATEAEVMDCLRQLADRYDAPAAFVDGVSVILEGDAVSVRTDHFHRPMRLTMAEVCALELGLSLLLHDSEGEQRLQRVAVRAKLQALITRLPQDGELGGLRAGELATGNAARVLPVLRVALRKRRVVLLDYQGPRDTEPTTKTVHPWRLTFSNGSWYLAGWCEENDASRIYRSDRIAKAVVTDREAMPEPEGAAEQITVDGKPFHREIASAALTVRYSPAIARWIEEREGGTLEADGSLVIEYPLADHEWAIRHVLQYGPDALVVAPEVIRQAVVERLEQIVGRLRNSASTTVTE